MEIQPVSRYKKPKYPIKQEVLHNPNILKTLPDRWKGNIYIGVALPALLTLTLTACGQKVIPGEGVVPVQTNLPDKPAAIKAEVAPIFEHGNGRGSFGCVSVAPPSFLSEEEALQVIQEEASKYGIMFEKNALEMKNVKLPETKYYLKPENNSDSTYKSDGGVVNSTRKGSLQLDGYDASKKIAFEFVSQDDYEKWHEEQGIRSSVEDYDFISTAKLLKDGITGKNGEASVGIFYNPMTMLSEEEILGAREQKGFQALEEKVKGIAKDELKKQVIDFLEWLKAQGII